MSQTSAIAYSKELSGFRQEYRDYATQTAEKTLAAGASATVTILQMAAWIQEMKSQLNRKEFGTFVKGLLQWVGDEARKYLDIARAFEGFDLSRLIHLEPFTILKLRSKRYAPIVASLREQPVITPNVVSDLIRELLPKLSRKKPDSNDQGWKQCHSGGGRYYNVLLHDEETGLSIEQQAEVEGILPQRVIAEAVALRAQHKSVQVQPSENVAAQLEKLQDLVKQAASLDTENKELMHQLQERDRRIAELEAKLTERASTTSAVPKETQVSHIHHEGSSEVAELDSQQGSNLRQLELSSSLHQAQTWLEVAAIVGCNRNQLLKIVNNWTLEQRQLLVKLLSAYLKREPNALENIAWIPNNLLFKALSTLEFKIPKIGGANNLVDAAQFEYICCNFVSLEYPGSRNEQWTFRDSDNRLYSIFGREEIEIER